MESKRLKRLNLQLKKVAGTKKGKPTTPRRGEEVLSIATKEVFETELSVYQMGQRWIKGNTASDSFNLSNPAVEFRSAF
jgi:hypothetical protein